MSATMSYTRFERRRAGWICGVCADLAERSAVPVAVPRVAFAIFLMLHGVLACVLYFGLAYLLCPSVRSRFEFRGAPPPASPPPGWPDFVTTDQRFCNLDERLSRLEAATVNSEAELRRAFRDLERRR